MVSAHIIFLVYLGVLYNILLSDAYIKGLSSPQFALMYQTHFDLQRYTQDDKIQIFLKNLKIQCWMIKMIHKIRIKDVKSGQFFKF